MFLNWKHQCVCACSVYVWVCVRMCVYMCACMRACLHTCMCVCIHVCVCVCACVYCMCHWTGLWFLMSTLLLISCSAVTKSTVTGVWRQSVWCCVHCCQSCPVQHKVSANTAVISSVQLCRSVLHAKVAQDLEIVRFAPPSIQFSSVQNHLSAQESPYVYVI